MAFQLENMRNSLIDNIINRNSIFNNPQIEEKALDKMLFEGIILMLYSCHLYKEHLDSNYSESEYLNDADFSANVKFLENIFIELDLKLPESNVINEEFTRFSMLYKILKGMIENDKLDIEYKKSQVKMNNAITQNLYLEMLKYYNS
jgi:hypothetical protein